MLLYFSFPYLRVSKNFDHQASPYVDEKSLIRLLEKLAAHTEFRTLTKGRADHHLHNVDNYHPSSSPPPPSQKYRTSHKPRRNC